MDIFNLIYPKSCCICSKYGEYLCKRCYKLFKKNLPECYICRRVSNFSSTHIHCKSISSPDSVFVCWEYDSLSSIILKRYKYSYVYDMGNTVSWLLKNCRDLDSFVLKNNSLAIIFPVPTSSERLRERGFNHTEHIAHSISNIYSIDCHSDMIIKTKEFGHQAQLSVYERGQRGNEYLFKKEQFNNRYKSIFLVDDVITTGRTLENITKTIRESLTEEIKIHAICMFRGRPNYSDF